MKGMQTTMVIEAASSLISGGNVELELENSPQDMLNVSTLFFFQCYFCIPPESIRNLRGCRNVTFGRY